jgi:predicted lipid-binding transport protein (Tim44 family)
MVTSSNSSANSSALFALLVAVCLSLCVVGETQAKPLGGGKSVGKQSRPAAASAAAAKAKPPAGAATQAPLPATGVTAPAPMAAAAALAPVSNRWFAPLAGVAAGVGLAALASHLGFAEEIASFVLFMLALAALMLVVRLVYSSRRGPPARQFMTPGYSYSGVGQEAMVAQQYTSVSVASVESLRRQATPVVRPSSALNSNAAEGAWRIPADFDVESFLRQAKSQYVRLQAAHDAADLAQLSDFTSPDLFVQIKAEIAARATGQSKTEILGLDAELLGLHSDAIEHMACVRFRGALRERAELVTESFDEVWNLTKPLDGTAGWLLAGVQQLSAVQ